MIPGISGLADLAGTIVSRFLPEKASEAEKMAAQMELQKLLEARETALLDAQKSVMVAELEQQDSYTKRARPTVVYAGLGFIFLVHVAIPVVTWVSVLLGRDLPDLPAFELPPEFWWAWTGVVGAYVLGRTYEKGHPTTGVSKLLTGGKL